MTVRALRLGERRVEVTGTGYAPSGEFREGGRAVDARRRRAPGAGPPDRRAVQRRHARPRRRRGRRPGRPDGGGAARRRRQGRDEKGTWSGSPAHRRGAVQQRGEADDDGPPHAGRPDGRLRQGAPGALADASDALFTDDGRPADDARGPASGCWRTTESWPGGRCASWPWRTRTCRTATARRTWRAGWCSSGWSA